MSSPGQGAHSTWTPAGSRGGTTQPGRPLVVIIPTLSGEETEVQRSCYTCPGHTADLAPCGYGDSHGSARLASPRLPAGWVEPSLQQWRQTAGFPRPLPGRAADPASHGNVPQPQSRGFPSLTNPPTHPHSPRNNWTKSPGRKTNEVPSPPPHFLHQQPPAHQAVTSARQGHVILQNTKQHFPGLL